MAPVIVRLAERAWLSDLSLSGFALGSVIFSFVLAPLADDVAWLSALILGLDLLFGLVIVTALTALTRRAWVGALALLGLVGLAIVRLTAWATPHPGVVGLDRALFLVPVVLLLLIVVLLSLRPGPITYHRVAGAVIAYLLIAVLWARAYELVDYLSPGSLTVLPHGTGGNYRFIYFSIMTLTSVAYGDVLPIHAAAQALACVEAVIGTLFPVVYISQFVSALQFRGEHPRS